MLMRCFCVYCVPGKVFDAYPFFEETGILDVIMPKKEPLIIAKWCVLKEKKSWLLSADSSLDLYILLF